VLSMVLVCDPPYTFPFMIKPINVVIVSCSLNIASRSHRLAVAAEASVRAEGATADLVDLREWELPICDGDGSFRHRSVEPLSEIVDRASAILVSAPVYNYDLNAAAKNFVEMTGQSWTNKPVGFLCAAGGQRSYMSPIGFANSLMFDFRCLIIPQFVYCTEADLDADGGFGNSVLERVNELAHSTVTLARALAWANSSSGRATDPVSRR
jgi:FMN reductase